MVFIGCAASVQTEQYVGEYEKEKSMDDVVVTKVDGLKNMLLPVDFYPKYSITVDDFKNQKIVEVNGIDTLTIATNNVGLVLVDAHGEGNEEGEPRGIVKNQKTFLEHQSINKKKLLEEEEKGEVYKKFKDIFSDGELLEVTKEE